MLGRLLPTLPMMKTYENPNRAYPAGTSGTNTTIQHDIKSTEKSPKADRRACCRIPDPQCPICRGQNRPGDQRHVASLYNPKMIASYAWLGLLAASSAAASIQCVKVGATATAKWTNAAGKSCTWTGSVGSNFGKDTVNNGEFVHFPSRFC